MSEISELPLLRENGFDHIDSLSFRGTTLSSAYHHTRTNTTVIIDHVAIFDCDFQYKLYCKHQNELMSHSTHLYRFIEHSEELQEFLTGSVREEAPSFTAPTFNRSDYSIDPTPVEYIFEECFQQVYGAEAYRYLQREYPFFSADGRTVYMDYALFRIDGTWVGVEENGITYHHPRVIGRNRYKAIIEKQNTAARSNGQVYRWDTESLGNREQILDELQDFLGPIRDYIIQHSVTGTRALALHEYQKDSLQALALDRSDGKNAALIVLPTGTGKTSIAVADIEHFFRSSVTPGKTVLILVPTLDLVRQWEEVWSSYDHRSFEVQVKTYAAASRSYFSHDAAAFDYIVVDEAHHALAPVMKKVLSHYQPQFLLGLTATDKRLDNQKLEEVFSHYTERMDLQEAIENGHLAQIRAYRLESNIDLSEVRFNGKDYLNSQLEKTIRVSSRDELIADVLRRHFYDKLQGKQGVVFCVSVDHAKEMAAHLRRKGLTAESVDGKDKDRPEKIKMYMDNKIQFLCTCSLLTEGWDAPQTSVIVMARPTLSRVLYTQQLGRGTRNFPGKEALYVIDVVDTYGSFGTVSNRPWSVHALFNLTNYTPFGDLFTRANGQSRELIELDTIHEKTIKLEPFDVFTLQKDYGEYLSPELLARELFVSTGTVLNWIRKGDVVPDVSIPLGRSSLHYFHPDRISTIREQKNLPEHTEETLVADFWDFINEGTYTFSYKIFFLTAFFDIVDETGEVSVHALVDRYASYYLDRVERGLPVDRNNCPYSKTEILQDRKYLIRSLLENPFEKFERKRFMYYCKDLSQIAFHHRLWAILKQKTEQEKLLSILNEHKVQYFQQLGGV